MSFLRYLGLQADHTSAAAVGREDVDIDTMRRIASELDALPEDRASHLAAFAYILGRIAHADSEFSEIETSKMQEVVRDLGHLPEAQAVLVVEIAKSQVQLFGGTDNFLVTRRFKEMTTREQRTELLDCVFAVSAADESISALEDGQAGQIAKELGLTHDEFVNARLTYREHLEAVKQFRGR
jgi:uncharacterized tellurite resistance protein B-like protein